MKIKFFQLIPFLFSFALSAETITDINIFIHGTRSMSRLFFSYSNDLNKIIHIDHVPSKYITHSIASVLDETDPINFARKQFYVFGWSGTLSHQARLEAAHALYEQIIKLTDTLKKEKITPRINLITHSHGGNVALNLAQCWQTHKRKCTINKLILLACPVQEHTRAYITHDMFEKVYNVYSSLDLIQILDPQGLHPELKGKKVAFFSGRTFDACPKLKQIDIKINNFGVPHAGFLYSRFLKKLPEVVI